MSLLRIDPADSQSLSEVPVEVRLFFRRRLRTSGRKAAQRISGSTHRAAGPRRGADEAAVSGDAWRVRWRCAGHSSWHANASEGPRLSAGDAGWRGFRGFFTEPAGLSRSGAHLPVADAGRRASGARRIERASADSDILSRALRDSGCREAGLQRVLRARVAFPEDDGVSTVYLAGQRDRTRYQSGKDDSLVAAAFRIYFTPRWRTCAHPGASDGAAGAGEEGAPVPVSAEVAEALGADEAAERGDGVCGSEGSSRNRGAGGYGPAKLVVTRASEEDLTRLQFMRHT